VSHKFSWLLKKTMLFEIVVACVFAMIIIFLLWKNVGINEGRFKIVYDVSINIMAASGLAFIIELIGAKINLTENIDEEKKTLLRHHLFIKHLISKYVASYIDLTTPDYSEATKLLSECDFENNDGVNGMRQDIAPVDLARMFGRSILVSDGMFTSPIVKWVKREQFVAEAFEKVVFSCELKFFSDLRNDMLAFMKSISDYDCNSQILEAFQIRVGKEKDTDWMTKCIKSGELTHYITQRINGEKESSYNAMRPYMCLFFKLKSQREILLAYENHIAHVINS